MIVGVTGSVGKTATKNAIYTVLKTHFSARKSVKSFNSEIGVPLTILGLPNGWNNPFLWCMNILHGAYKALFAVSYPAWLVLEIGADTPGDIARTVAWLQLDVAVIGKIGRTPVHVEHFDSVDQLVQEKHTLIKGLKKDGTAVIFADDENAPELVVAGHEKITFGIHDADVVGSDYKIIYNDNVPEGISFKISHKGVSENIELIGVLGRQHMYPFLAGFAVGVVEGLTLSDMKEAVKEHVFEAGRVRILKGQEGSLLIDDSYNSSPIAVQAVLQTLSSLDISGKKIAILGDMTELGDLTTMAHKEISELARKSADIFISVGPRFAHLASDKHFATSADAIEYVKSIVGAGNVVLVKGSQAMRMEHITKALLAQNESADNLLVRQEKVWKKM